MKLFELDELVRAVCPIDGLNSEGVIWFKEEATEEQRNVGRLLIQQHLSALEIG